MCVSLDSTNEADEGEYGNRPSVMKGKSERDARSESQIGRQFDEMVDSMDRLERSWGNLHTKIGPIIGPPKPELAEKDLGEDREEMSDHAAKLNDMADRMNNLRSAINSVYARLEI
jgi:hypothetical protein